jgi:hypothetical protein
MGTVEVWKPVRNYDGYLEVSNFGNIKVLERLVDSGVGGRMIPERILPVRIKKSGKNTYGRVDFTLDNKAVTLTVAKIVYEVFNDIYLDTKKVVTHKDGNKLNNRLENLCVITRRNTCCPIAGESGYIGVKIDRRNKNRYSSIIHFEGRQIYLHSSENKEECHKIYQLAKAMFDEYDKLKAGILSNSRLNNKIIVKSLPIK